MRPRLPILILLVALVAVGGLWLRSGSDARDGHVVPSAGAQAARAPGAAGRRTGEEPALPEDHGAGGGGERAPLDPFLGEDPATLIVKVTDVTTGKPVPRERVAASPVGRKVQTVEVDTEDPATIFERPRTDDEGRVEFQLPAGEYEVHNARGDTRTLIALTPGALETVELSIDALTRPFHARVFGADSGRALAGARLSWEGSRDVGVADHRGRIASSAWRFSEDVGTVTAPGFGAARILASDRHATAEEALRIELHPSAELSGSVRDRMGDPVAGGRVVVRGALPVFGLEADEEARAQEWETTVADDGSYRFAGMPRYHALQVRFLHKSRSIPLIRDVRLSSDTVLNVELDAGTRVFGEMLTDDGRPLTDVRLWLVAGVAGFGSEDLAVASVRTDTEGRYAIPDVQPGTWTLLSDGPLDNGRLLPEPRTCVVGSSGEQRVSLIAPKPLYITGRCVDADDETIPIEGIWLEANAVLGRASIGRRSQPGGEFRLGPLPAGTFQIITTEFTSGLALTRPVVADAGAEGVVVRMKRRSMELEGSPSSPMFRGPSRSLLDD